MSADSNTWMIYGANGYTGHLIARQAAAEGRNSMLAGRDKSKIETIAKELGCSFRAFSLFSPELTEADPMCWAHNGNQPREAHTFAPRSRLSFDRLVWSGR